MAILSFIHQVTVGNTLCFSPKFSKIKVDPDQTAAVKKIVENGVTVMSGKGGCGKTEVVSTIFMDPPKPEKEDFPEIDDTDCTEMVGMENQNSDVKSDSTHNSVEKEVTDVKPEFNDTVKEMEPVASCSKTKPLMLSPLRRNVQFVTPPSSPFKASGDGFATPTKNEARNENDQTPSKSPGKAKNDEPAPDILMTAPTGKAANLLGKRTGVKAYTMHQVIYSYFGWKKMLKQLEMENKPKTEWQFSDVEVWVVDECSLVSVRPFSTLLGMLQDNAQLQKMVLLGDIHQLPSVEPGNFLEDVYKALDKYGLAIKLTKNYR